jgi:hypothetical protein
MTSKLHPRVTLRTATAWSLPALVIVVASADCGDFRFQAGLANVPAINRRWTDEDFAHNVIANGDESCPPSGRPEDDRFFSRWPPCASAAKPVLTAPRTAPPPLPRRGPGPLAPLRSPGEP